MKLWVLSDLHLDYEDMLPIPPADADVCIVAGDVTNGVSNAMHWIGREIAAFMPTIFVAGNHEFYRYSVVEQLAFARQIRLPNVHFLENSSVVIGGVRFVGATLWTDFALDSRSPRDLAWAMATAEGMLTDYRAITWTQSPHEAFTAGRARELHEASAAYIRRELQSPFDGPTVVVTHHAPHRNSVHERYGQSALNGAFASDLSGMIEIHKPALWVHGHVHDSFDYRVRDTRVGCNPRGYGNENPRFDPGLVVEI
ncbi:metallophosphoesterase [Mesorhizobium sp. AR07]|uniref:metallophosphoesterase n=1 Tax=Mesorhizobium sp. AR07 TaxID=2865838 RepID=UPI00215F80B2|nr:metallophosphoesterase [Mesorhizobium sp. AR07]UVK44382.1 metallophosphoesterase [Mesorhizobium sp. AR07]